MVPEKPKRRYSAIYVSRLLDDLSRFSDFHKLVEIAQEQFDYPEPDLMLRVQVLIEVYLTEATPLLKQLRETSQILQNLPLDAD